MRAILLVLILSFLCATAAQAARLYQWVSPETGTLQLSGKPPPWYRSADGGPRVRVYEHGVLVDDTAMNLPEEHRQALREAAFRSSSAAEQSQALRKLDQMARRQAARDAEQARRTRQASAQPPSPPAQSPQSGEKGESAASSDFLGDSGQLDAATVQQLKAIITEWDRRNTGEATPAP